MLKKFTKVELTILIVLFVAIVLLIFDSLQQRKDKERLNNEIIKADNKFKEETQQRDSIRILDLEKTNNLRSEFDQVLEEIDNYRNEINNLNYDLEEKESEIDLLKDEIRYLLNVENDLVIAKTKIVSLQNISKRYFAQVDSLLGITEYQKNEIRSLTLKNKEIISQNNVLIEENLEQNARLEIGSSLEVYDIKIDKFKIGRHEEEKRVNRAKNVQILRSCFSIAKNLIAKSEVKRVYVQYISPSNKLLFSATTPQESLFWMGDSVVYSTTYIDVDYKNDDVNVCVDWQRQDILERGKYKIIFYIDEKFAGIREFRLL